MSQALTKTQIERRADAAEARLVLAATVLLRRAAHRSRDALLAVAGVVAALLLAELGLRVYIYLRTEKELARMQGNGATDVLATGIGHLAPGVRISPFPQLRYELRPNLHGTYDGHRYRSDAHGFREDGDVALARAPGVKRVLGVGDSWMFGTGVDNGETYLDRLREALPGTEVINTGVWGYDAEQQIATLRFKGLAFHPDVVVVGLCGNDREYPTFLSKATYVEPGHSYLVDEISSRVLGRATVPDAARMPFSDFVAAYAELAALAESNGFAVVVFSECFGKDDDGVQHRSCRLGDAQEWTKFVAELDAWGFHRCPWDIDAIPQNAGRVGHATVEGNRVLAAVLARCVAPLLR